MADPFVAEIRIVPFNFAPKGWAFCDGQILPISQNTALFSLLGTTYGGDGKSTFALPNLQGAAAMHPGRLRIAQFVGTVDDAWIVYGRTRLSAGRLTAWRDSPAGRLYREAA